MPTVLNALEKHMPSKCAESISKSTNSFDLQVIKPAMKLMTHSSEFVLSFREISARDEFYELKGDTSAQQLCFDIPKKQLSFKPPQVIGISWVDKKQLSVSK